MTLSCMDKLWIKFKSLYLRITFSKFTLAFMIFGLLHCFAQGLIQSLMFSLDSDANTLVTSIVDEAQISKRELPWLTRQGDDLDLKLCREVPIDLTVPSCFTVFQSGQPNLTLSARDQKWEIGSSRIVNESLSTTSDAQGVTVQLPYDRGTQFFSTQCTETLVYPQQVLQNFKREDLSQICVQFWLFFMSFAAVAYDSVPHTVALLCARILTTAWSAYALWRLSDIDTVFRALVSDSASACQVDLFPTYFQSRRPLALGDLMLNITALVISACLSINLLKVSSSRTFKRVGAPPEIMRIYHYFLAVFVCLQLSGFLLMTAMGLWIDQLFNTGVAYISRHTTIYIAAFLFTTITLVPWIMLGWFAVRRERRPFMTAFLSLGFVFIAVWSIMFYSQVYRWQFIQFPFFACITIQSFVVLIASCLLGVVCWRNFDKGLDHYLYVEDVLSNSDFEPAVFPRDLEKGDAADDVPDFSELELKPRYRAEVLDIKGPAAPHSPYDPFRAERGGD
ncbi:hypothetical protein PLICRDRAFT_58289 [Plicaturopsis crispa FD-325 SS-3]|uniref:Uncharacterized protein n=1 Tax=Plicaturopsis crispa FD-325 SS-3 TaxID=944288 RepID=A0A0C9T6V6_PLICR|nr:hypothetical protein PLICRDRAFT_58289 [Plicaturopsis crispa FD-325 SS-3]